MLVQMVRAFEARRSLPSFEQSFRGRAPRASDVLRREGLPPWPRGPGCLFSNGSLGGPTSQVDWPLACGWSAIVAADRPVDSPVLGRQDPRSGRSSSRRASAWPRPPPSVWGTSLHGFQAPQPFPLGRVI